VRRDLDLSASFRSSQADPRSMPHQERAERPRIPLCRQGPAVILSVLHFHVGCREFGLSSHLGNPLRGFSFCSPSGESFCAGCHHRALSVFLTDFHTADHRFWVIHFLCELLQGEVGIVFELRDQKSRCFIVLIAFKR
jgi:hypothetical protein